MKVQTLIVQSMIALATSVSTLAPLAAHAQSDAGGSLLAGLQYEARNFAVISAAAGAKGAVTCTDSTILGNVGSSGKRPAVVQTRCSITGRVVAPVTPAVLAQVNSEFDSLTKRQCQKQLVGTLAGRILAPGVYCFAASASLTGQLTLNGSPAGVWVFQVNGNLTGKSFSMVMANGAKPCNVYLVSSGATTMTTSNAKANIYAGQAITMTGGSFVGRAFAKKAVTMTNLAATGCGQ